MNLTQSEIQTLKQIKKEKKLIVLNTDKNLGPAIMETTKYYQHAFQDHLSNQTNYKEISATEAHQYSYVAFLKICALMIDDPYDDQSRKFFISKLIGGEKECQRDKFGQVQPLPHLQLPYFFYFQRYIKNPGKQSL